MKTPWLQGKHAALVEFTEKHISVNYVSWLNDPEVVRFSENRHGETTATKCYDYFRRMKLSENIFWAILANDLEDRHVGNISIYIDQANQVCDLAIMLGDADVRGMGIGTEAAKLACDWLLGDGGFRKVTVGMMAANQPMMNLMENIGMVEEGRRHRQFLWNGNEIDMVFAAKFRDGQ
jgi:[ribosomal protein S5]-alanine N-acetyltransferase